MNSKKAFTLIEVVLVLFIIGLISTLMYIGYSAVQKNALVSNLKSDLSNSYEQLDVFQSQKGNYPTTANCAVADSDTNLCLKSSKNVTLSYQYGDTLFPKTYCLTATSGTTSYYVKGSSDSTDAASFIEGTCNNTVVNACTAVTSGLKLCLDAGSRQSYPGTGTTWTDISGNSVNATLVNGPVWTSAGGGSFNFNGTNQYGDLAAPLPAATNQYTIESCWRTTTSSRVQVVYEQNAASLTNNQRSSITIFNYVWGFNGEWNDAMSSIFVATDAWTCGSVVMNTTLASNPLLIYQNGNLAFQGNTSGSASNLSMANYKSRIGAKMYGTEFFLGQIAIVRVYNRTLSAAEISTNFNTIKSRFGF